MMKTVSLCDLNQHIVCKLCHGYYIDPVTLVECLHSFCKTCIVKHVTSNKMCPVCDVQIHKTKPFVSMRSDKTLQNIVYKLVPGLYKNEMQRRKKFMEKHEPTKVPREQLEKHFFFRDDNISMSIEYYDPQNPDGSSPDKSNPNKRYLACPGTVKIQQLKKFIIMKYGLNDNFLVDVIYMNDLIPEDYTLIDVAYYYEWKKDAPMKFFYRIFKKNRVLLKRRKRKLETDESSTPTPTDDAKKRKSCSMDDDTSNTAGTSGAGGGSSNGCDGLAGTGISGRDQSVDVRSCPVASHAKKNDTTANATDCSVKPDEAVHDHKEAAPDPDEAKGHNDSITKSEQSNGSTEKPKATQDEGRLMELQNLDKKNSGGGHNDKVNNNNNNNNKEPEKRPQLQPKLSLSKQSKPGPPGGQILSVVNNLAKKQQHLEAAAAAAAAASAPSTSSISSASPNTTARTLSEAVAVTCSSQICPTVTAVTTSSETLRAPLANGFSPTSSVAKSPPTTPSLKGPLPSILSMKNFVQASKPAEREELNSKKNTTPSPTQPKPPQPVVPELRQFRKFPLATNTTTTTTTSTTTTTTSPESSSCPSVMSSSTTAGAALSLTSTRLPIFPQLTLSGRNGSSSSPKISLSSATSPSHRSMSAKSEDISRSSPSSSPSSSSAVLQLALANSNSQSSTSTTSCKSVPITSTALTVTPAQLPSSRLQLKVQNTLPSPLPATPATTPVSTASLISPYQAAFQSTLYSHYAADALWKQATLALAAASAGSNGAAVAAAAAAAVGAAPSSSGSSSTTTTNNAGNNGMSSFGSGSNGTKTLLPKTLNQGIRQIPNPSLLTKQHQHATSANSNSDPLLQEKVIMAMAAAASVANTRPSTTN